MHKKQQNTIGSFYVYIFVKDTVFHLSTKLKSSTRKCLIYRLGVKFFKCTNSDVVEKNENRIAKKCMKFIQKDNTDINVNK